MHVHVLCMWQCLYIYIAMYVYCNVLIIIQYCILYKMHIMSSVVARGGAAIGVGRLGWQNCTCGVDEMVRMKDESFQRYKKFGKNR